jgi:hypothetical protein
LIALTPSGHILGLARILSGQARFSARRGPNCRAIIPPAGGGWTEPALFEWELRAESCTDEQNKTDVSLNRRSGQETRVSAGERGYPFAQMTKCPRVACCAYRVHSSRMRHYATRCNGERRNATSWDRTHCGYPAAPISLIAEHNTVGVRPRNAARHRDA